VDERTRPEPAAPRAPGPASARAGEAGPDLAAGLVRAIAARGLTVAVAESLTGGLLCAELVKVPGASVVVNGGITAYNTGLKHTLLGVDARLLAEHGPVHPDVAAQMASGVRAALSVDGRAADIGLSTTGVAGPGPQGGHPAGTVFIGIAVGAQVRVVACSLAGDRDRVRAQTVRQALLELATSLGIR
jgi:nicotinamide-nucleotide amidase